MSLLKNDFFSLSTIVEDALSNRLKNDPNYSEAEIAEVMNRSERLFDRDVEISSSVTEDFRFLTSFSKVELKARNLSSHRKYIGPWIVLFKKLAFRVIALALKDTLRSQEMFNRGVVKSLAKLRRDQLT